MVIFSTLAGTLILLGLFTFVDILLSRKVFLVKNVCVGIFVFYALFIASSGVLLAFDIYSFWICYGICFGLGAVSLLTVFFLKYKGVAEIKLIEREKDLPRYFLTCIIGLLVFGALMSWGKFEYFGMGQDQGVYQTAAIFRTAGYNNKNITLNSYNALETDEDRALYIEIYNNMRTPDGRGFGNIVGLYTDGVDNSYSSDEVSGYLHGIPTHGAFLSISGRIFGLSGLSNILTLLFLSAVGLLFVALCYNLKLKLPVSVFITALFIISPIVLWTSKASLTECSLTLIMVAFLFLMTSNERYLNKLLWLPVASFAFLHTTIFTMMPMFVILFIVLYVQKRDKNIIVSGVIALIAYLCGFFAMLSTSPGYTVNCYEEVMNVASFLRFDQSGLVTFVCLITVAASAAIVISRYTTNRLNIIINAKVFLITGKYLMLICLVYILFNMLDGLVKHFIEDLPHNFNSVIMIIRAVISTLPNSTIFTYAFLSGFIILPIVLFGLFMKREVFAEKEIIPITAVFIYCIVIYSALFKRNIENLYYMARYLAPFIPVILVMGGVYINKFKPKPGIAVLCISILLTAPFAFFVVGNKDQTRMDWNGFEDVVSAVDELSEDDIVIVSEECVRFFFLPLDVLTDSVILPDSNFKLTADKLENRTSGKVYLLYRKREFDSDNTKEFWAWSSVYPIVPGILPPLPLHAEYDDQLYYLSEVTSSYSAPAG